MDIIAYFKWLQDAERSPEERQERWDSIGIVIPLSRWKKIVDENEGIQSWDTLVECELNEHEASVIGCLGYYGHAIRKGDHVRLYKGIPYDDSGYSILKEFHNGIHEEQNFKTIENVRTFVNKYVGEGAWCKSDGLFCTDYVNYFCHGFVLSDLNIKWLEHTA